MLLTIPRYSMHLAPIVQNTERVQCNTFLVCPWGWRENLNYFQLLFLTYEKASLRTVVQYGNMYVYEIVKKGYALWSIDTKVKSLVLTQ